jgi:hypothetical protein
MLRPNKIIFQPQLDPPCPAPRPRLNPDDRTHILTTLSHTATLLTQTHIKSARRAALVVIAYAYPLFNSVASSRAAATALVHFPHTIALSAAASAWPTEETADVALWPLVA